MNILGILKDKNFVAKKQFGQNFICDAALLSAITDDAGITDADTVLEIGAGAGTLTCALAKKAKRVIAFEIDKTLDSVLAETLKGTNNVELVFRDVLKTTPTELAAMAGGPFKVVANLPYYITSPVLFYLLENDFPLLSLTVMVQYEVARRMVAEPDTPDYGALTLAISSRADAVITRKVGREMFFPMPNVDSAVVRLDLHEDIACRKTFDALVKCAFSMRRKTFVNNLMRSFGMQRADAENLLVSAGLDTKVRGEALGKEQFIALIEIMEKQSKNGCICRDSGV